MKTDRDIILFVTAPIAAIIFLIYYCKWQARKYACLLSELQRCLEAKSVLPSGHPLIAEGKYQSRDVIGYTKIDGVHGYEVFIKMKPHRINGLKHCLLEQRCLFRLKFRKKVFFECWTNEYCWDSNKYYLDNGWVETRAFKNDYNILAFRKMLEGLTQVCEMIESDEKVKEHN